MYLWFTYGPSTDSDDLLEKTLIMGANGCRLTFSYGTRELQKQRADRLKRIAERIGRPCLVIADLAGEKVRLGNFVPTHVEIKAGDYVFLCSSERETKASSKLFSITSQRLFHQVQVGERIIVGDGSLSLSIISVNGDRINTVALEDGIVNPNRGITVQGGDFLPASLTDKDVDDLIFIAQSLSFDAIALSFVSDSASVANARKIMQDAGRIIPVVAKIETAQGLDNLPSIVEETDLILAARGDLTLAIDWPELPASMERIQQICADKSKPWLLATQVVEGLERFIFPTRAEICDLAFWLTQGASGVLLSYETVFGKRPIESIRAVARMIERWGRT